MNRCFKCYGELSASEINFHTECAHDIFGAAAPLEVSDQTANSYDIVTESPELLDLTLRLAQAASILTMRHTLAPNRDGGVLCLIKRLDVGVSGQDCEVDTIRLILDEEAEIYRSNGSYEQIAQIIEEHSTISKLDVLNFWEQLAFGWVAGCSQMDSLSFALYQPHRGLYTLAPAYNLLATAILNPTPGEGDELKLTLNRKRRNIARTDFEAAMKRSGIKERAIKGMFARFVGAQDIWSQIIDNSFIDEELKTKYKTFLRTQLAKL